MGFAFCYLSQGVKLDGITSKLALLSNDCAADVSDFDEAGVVDLRHEWARGQLLVGDGYLLIISGLFQGIKKS